MKKIIIAMIAVLMMALSAVPAFAKCYESPVATNPQCKTACTPTLVCDKGTTAPKTGSDDSLAYALVAVSALGIAAASFALVKTAKKN